MKEKTPAPKRETRRKGKEREHQNTQAPTVSKETDSGIAQPHNAKKQGLGPNTDR